MRISESLSQILYAPWRSDTPLWERGAILLARGWEPVVQINLGMCSRPLKVFLKQRVFKSVFLRLQCISRSHEGLVET